METLSASVIQNANDESMRNFYQWEARVRLARHISLCFSGVLSAFILNIVLQRKKAEIVFDFLLR